MSSIHVGQHVNGICSMCFRQSFCIQIDRWSDPIHHSICISCKRDTKFRYPKMQAALKQDYFMMSNVICILPTEPVLKILNDSYNTLSNKVHACKVSFDIK